jgi:hypothetical protein
MLAISTSGIRRFARRLIPIPVVLAPLALGACDSLIEIDAPSRVLADQLNQPQNAGLIANSVGADFECALAHYIVATAMVGNEFEAGTTLLFMTDYDKRDFNPVSSAYAAVTCSDPFVDVLVGLYKPLSTARWQADNATSRFEQWTDAEVPDRQRLIATAANYAGHALVLLGESMCTAAIDVGPELTPAQLFQAAEQRFTKGLAAGQAANAPDLRSWALVGRARARARLGRFTEAAADAQLVPDGFVKNATYSGDSPRRENLVWAHNQRSRSATVDASYRHLTFAGVPDPRVSLTLRDGSSSDGITPLWSADKYTDNSTPIPFATWIEARLIQAEAALGQAAVDIINQLHDRAGLPHFASSSAAVIKGQIVEERRRELFLDGHHFGDLRQYNLPLNPAPGSPFKQGGTYRSQTCFPLPNVERLNNPNINK